MKHRMCERERCETFREEQARVYRGQALAIPGASTSVENSVTLGTFVFSDFREIGDKGKEAAPQLTEDGDQAKETKAC